MIRDEELEWVTGMGHTQIGGGTCSLLRYLKIRVMTEVVNAYFCSRSMLADTNEMTTVSCLQPSFLRLHEN